MTDAPAVEPVALFGADESSSTFGRWTMRVAATVDFPLVDGSRVTITQNASGVGELGSHMWDAGFVLARFVDRHLAPQLCGSTKRAIELGSGVGEWTVTTIYT